MSGKSIWNLGVAHNADARLKMIEVPRPYIVRLSMAIK